MASYRLAVRRDTAANWTSADPILAQGEFGYETDTGLLKIGDGVTAWTALGFYDPSAALGTGGSLVGDFKYTNSTTDATAGRIGFDSLTPASITKINLSVISLNDFAWTGQADRILPLDSVVVLLQKNDTTKWVQVTTTSSFTNNVTYYTYDVTFNDVGPGGLPQDGRDCLVEIIQPRAFALDLLDDVTITNPQLNDGLQYDGAEWVNGPISATVPLLNNIGDVNTTGQVFGNVLRYNGASWVPTAETIEALDGLTDTNITSPASGEVLQYSGGSWVNASAPVTYGDADVDTHLNTSTATTGEVLSWTGTDYDWIAAGGGGATVINDLTDVDTTGVAGGDVLKWNGTKWTPTTDDDTVYTDADVDTHLNTGTAGTGEVLSWTGSDYDWIAAGGYTNADVDTHLNTSTATANQVLEWDGADYAWVDQAASSTLNPLELTTNSGSTPTPYVWMDFANNMNDSGSANLPATSGSTPVYTADRDGVSNHAYVYSSSSTLFWSTSPVNPNSDFFWGIWYKSDGTTFGTNSIVLGTAYSAGNELIHIGATPVNSTTAQLQIKHTQSGAWATAVASTQPTWTDWNHYAMVKSGNTLYLYLNGAVVATTNLAGTYTYNTVLNVGLYGSGRATGDYDDIQLYSTLPITPGASFNPEFIGGGDVVVAEIEATGTTTDSTLVFKQYESGVLTSYDLASLSGGGSGTVTSVGMTVPTGLSVSGSPVTSSGTLAVTYTAGYAIPTTAKQTQWDTAYGWGDHSVAGYLTSFTETDTLDSVTGRGATTTNNISVGDITADQSLTLANGAKVTVSTGNSAFTDFLGGSTNDTADDGLFAFYGGRAFNQGAGVVLYGDDHATAPNVISFRNTTYVERLAINADGTASFKNGIQENQSAVTSSAGSLTVDCTAGNIFSLALSENVTSTTFSNPPATGTAFAFSLFVTQDATARTIAWPASVAWPSATAPTLSATSGDVDIFTFTTFDGGTTWYGVVSGQAL